MVLFCQKMVEQYQKVKNLYSRKKFAFFTLTLPPTPPRGCSAFSLQFIPFRIAFFGRSPLKAYALFIAWSIICSIKLQQIAIYKGFQHC